MLFIDDQNVKCATVCANICKSDENLTLVCGFRRSSMAGSCGPEFKGESQLKNFFGHNLSADMIILWLVETLVCFVAVYAAASHSAVLSSVSASISSAAIVRAFDITALLGCICLVLGLYKPEAITQPRMLFLSTGVAAVCASGVFLLVRQGGSIGLVASQDGGPSVALMAFCWLVLLVATRLIYMVAARCGVLTRQVLVLGEPDVAQRIAADIRKHGSPLFRVADTVPDPSKSRWSRKSWLAVSAPERLASASDMVPQGVPIVDIYTFLEKQFGQVDLSSLDRVAGLNAVMRGGKQGTAARAVRRTLDIGAASILIVLSAPVMALTALAVMIDSPGPVIYRQERVGLNGRRFVILKFRSMRSDAEKDGVAKWASVGDSRVTRVGAFIRRVRLDELPQLFNIIRGEMSMVGPRPERPAFVETLSAAIPHFALRSTVKPGLTGWAQIRFAYTSSAEEAREKLAYDLYYVKNRTLVLDALILVATIRIILFQIGSR